MPSIPNAQTVGENNKFWKNLLYTVLGTSISIIPSAPPPLSSSIVRPKTAR